MDPGHGYGPKVRLRHIITILEGDPSGASCLWFDLGIRWWYMLPGSSPGGLHRVVGPVIGQQAMALRHSRAVPKELQLNYMQEGGGKT